MCRMGPGGPLHHLPPLNLSRASREIDACSARSDGQDAAGAKLGDQKGLFWP